MQKEYLLKQDYAKQLILISFSGAELTYAYQA